MIRRIRLRHQENEYRLMIQQIVFRDTAANIFFKIQSNKHSVRKSFKGMGSSVD